MEALTRGELVQQGRVNSETIRYYVVVGVLCFPPLVHAGDQAVLGSKFLLTDDLAPNGRRMVVKAREARSNDSIVGNPVATGAVLTIRADGGTSTGQVFTPAAGTSPR